MRRRKGGAGRGGGGGTHRVARDRGVEVAVGGCGLEQGRCDARVHVVVFGRSQRNPLLFR